MFDQHNHVHAIATAFGTMGGFQSQPDWFKSAAESPVWQVICAAVLVYQGGGALDPMYSLVIAILFYMFVEATKYINFSKAGEVASEDAASAEEVGSPEYYSNYY